MKLNLEMTYQYIVSLDKNLPLDSHLSCTLFKGMSSYLESQLSFEKIDEILTEEFGFSLLETTFSLNQEDEESEEEE